MKILIVQNTDWLNRNPGQQHHLAEMLSRRGHEIRVIDFEITWRTHGRRELHSKREIFRNVSKIHHDAKVTVIRPSIAKVPILDYISMMLSHWKEVRRQIREFRPEIILSFGIVAYLAGKAARKNRIPFVYYWIDVSHRLIPFKFLRPVGWVVERRTLRLASEILAINEKLREYVVGLGAPSKETRVLKAGIDFDQFNLHIRGDEIRKQYGLKEQDVVLFFMGWLYNFSGLEEVALRLARNENSKFRLLIVGEGDAYARLRQIQEHHNLKDTMILAGKRPYSEIPKFIAASDICLLPAYPDEKIMQDIVPIKIYEYMAMGKPVISSRLPGVLKEFGEDNGVVYINRPEDAISKATEIIDSNSLKQLGRKARSFAEKYSWDHVTSEFESILKEKLEDVKGICGEDSNRQDMFSKGKLTYSGFTS